ncbi:MAG: DNA replication/repair protein RecF [Microcystaceae cyanobacterium]
MYLKHLSLRSFRNYDQQAINFHGQKTILVGNNAQGKSNLLESVELLATLKSHRVLRDREFVLEGAEMGHIQGSLERQYGEVGLSIILRCSGKRTLSVNQEVVRRQTEFLGLLNAVVFSSLDLGLVRGSPDLRRTWLDTLVTQLEPVYAYILQQYGQILRQRNALLKQLRKNDLSNPDLTQLKLWDQQLAEMGSRVTRRRARVIERLYPIACHWHEKISQQTEKLEINYNPNINWQNDDPEQVKAAFLQKIEERRLVEQQLGATVVGPHRDDIIFTIDQNPAKSYGSQGQQRTLVLALKLAELQLIEEVIGEPPLLLLDDVLAELDPQRQNQLLETIQERFQTLITTTHLQSFDAGWLKSSQILTVEKGEIISG